jgi:hypothetical protein
MAALSCARMMSASTPWVIRLSMSASCLEGEVCASADTYSAPAASSAATIAASSVFQRSSRKFDQLTPTVIGSSCAKAAVPASATTVVASSIDLVIGVSPWLARPRVCRRFGSAGGGREREGSCHLIFAGQRLTGLLDGDCPGFPLARVDLA